jgi:excisionase family DNA binding protein
VYCAMPERVYPIHEATKLLGVSAQTIRRWEREGKIRCYRTAGGYRVVPESEINRILGIENKVESSQPSPVATPTPTPPPSTEIRLKRIQKDGKIMFVLADKDQPPT